MPCLPRLSLEPVHKLRLPSRLGEGLNQKIRLDDNWGGGGSWKNYVIYEQSTINIWIQLKAIVHDRFIFAVFWAHNRSCFLNSTMPWRCDQNFKVLLFSQWLDWVRLTWQNHETDRNVYGSIFRHENMNLLLSKKIATKSVV